MQITSMTIKTAGGEQIEIAATNDGALVTHGDRVIGELKRAMNDDAQFEIAIQTANAIYGEGNATNSMIHTVWRSIQQVAGC